MKEETEKPFTIQKDGTYSCNMCAKVYKQLGYLKKHLSSNHNFEDSVSYNCKKCNKSFDSKKKLTRHENNKSDCSK